MKCDNQGPIESPTRTLIAGDYVIPEGFSAEINIEGRIVVVRKKENWEEQAKRSMLRLIEAFHDVNFPTPEGFSREDLCAWVNSYKTGCAKERALSFIEFLDKNSYAGKMCVSNPECEDIVNAFVEKDWAKVIAYANKYLCDHGIEEKPESRLPHEQKPAGWSDEDEKKIIFLERLIEHNVPDGQYGLVDGMKGGFVTKPEAISMLKSIRQQPNNNLRWLRATEGANLPESIIIPDGEEPRFGKFAVRDSYYIPVEELKNLPKDES